MANGDLQLYLSELTELNPLMTLVEQIYYSSYDTKQTLPVIDGIDLTKFTYDNSLLHRYSSTPFIYFENMKPVNIINYDIIVSIAQEYVAPPHTITPFNFHACHFYDHFFRYHPHSLNTTNCRGDKCRRTVETSGIWCDSCHDEFEESCSNLSKIMHHHIPFCTIPFFSILKIEKKMELFDLKNIKHQQLLTKHIDEDISELEELRERIDVFDDEMQRLIQQQEYRKQRVIELENKYGMSIKDYKYNILSEYDNK